MASHAIAAAPMAFQDAPVSDQGTARQGRVPYPASAKSARVHAVAAAPAMTAAHDTADLPPLARRDQGGRVRFRSFERPAVCSPWMPHKSIRRTITLARRLGHTRVASVRAPERRARPRQHPRHSRQVCPCVPWWPRVDGPADQGLHCPTNADRVATTDECHEDRPSADVATLRVPINRERSVVYGCGPLGTYLQDHLAGAVMAIELMEHIEHHYPDVSRARASRMSKRGRCRSTRAPSDRRPVGCHREYTSQGGGMAQRAIRAPRTLCG